MEWLTELIASVPSLVQRAVFQFIANMLSGGVFEKLPPSPTFEQEWVSVFAAYSGYVNYFIPVGGVLLFAVGLLSCIAVYYTVSIVLRLTRIVS